MQININNTEYNILVQSTKKQSMSLQITPEGLITVLAPKKSTEVEILAFVKKNANTLAKAKKRVEDRVILSSVKMYQENENFMYLGKLHTLQELIDTIPEKEEEIQLLLKQFYTKQTKEIIENRISYFEPIIGVKSKGFKIVDSPKTWGTCNSARNLTFNYKLSMATPQAIDYVVIHELCHILHMNHDRSFWRKIGMYDKDYKAHQEFLARFGAFMTI